LFYRFFVSVFDIYLYIIGQWKRDHDGYQFCADQLEGIYNPARILHGLRTIQYTLDASPSLLTRTPEVVAAFLLSPSRGKNANTTPAETILHLVASNPTFISVFDDLLSKEKAPFTA